MHSLSRRQLLGGAVCAAGLPALGAAAEDTIGARLAPEVKTLRDPETGRAIRQLTSARANSYTSAHK